MSRPELSENHRRVAGIILTQMDEVLGVVESWAKGRAAGGVFYLETNDLSPRQREALRRQVDGIRELLREARSRLGLAGTEVRASGEILSHCAAVRDTMNELRAKPLREYGELAPEFKEYLDGISARLVDALDRLADTVGKDEDHK